MNHEFTTSEDKSNCLSDTDDQDAGPEQNADEGDPSDREEHYKQETEQNADEGDPSDREIHYTQETEHNADEGDPSDREEHYTQETEQKVGDHCDPGGDLNTHIEAY